MLIIGHRGSAGTKPENTIASLRDAIEAGADMVEFDIRTTKDGYAILSHDFHMLRTHKHLDIASRHTLAELRHITSGSDRPVTTLDQAMKECFGKTLVNVEIKRLRGVVPAIKVLKTYCKTKAEWETVLISSFNPLALKRVRQLAPKSQLALLHHLSPYDFMAWHRVLNLSAVGFHRLHISELALRVAHLLGLFTYAYTVNRSDAVKHLAKLGIDGVVTNYPAQMIKKFPAD